MRNLDDIRQINHPALPQFIRKSVPQRPLIIPATEQDLPADFVQHPVRAARKRSFKMPILVAFTIFVLGFGAFIGARLVSFAGSVSTASNNSIANNIAAALSPVIPGLRTLDNSSIAQAQRNGSRVNILLLGYGGAGHDGSLLTDTIMVLSIDFKNNTATYIPVPRDLWVNIPTHGYDGPYMKINAAYAIGEDQKNYPDKLPQFTGINGGGDTAEYEVSQVLGIPINYYASVDFYAFQKIVDILGGVDVNVQNSFTDYSYPNGDQNVNAGYCDAQNVSADLLTACRFTVVHFDKGLQHMDGATALEFARSRHGNNGEGSDFARSKRQELLLGAIEQKALSVGALSKSLSLLNALQGHVLTDLSLADIADLSNYLKSGAISQPGHISLTDPNENLLVSSWSSDGQWILVPQAGQNDFSAIRSYINQNLR